MSTWTHVNGCLRVDGIPGITKNTSKQEIIAIMGSICDFDSDNDSWDRCGIPCGSEGSLKYDILKAGDGLVLWTIPIWGDLRNYDDKEEIKSWFNGVCKKLMIRSAILEIAVNGDAELITFTGE